MLKTLLFICLLGTCLTCIGWIFWEQELQYSGPTPIPEGYEALPVNSFIDLKELNISGINLSKPVFLHFYNYHCPCSRFNATEFSKMVTRFKDDIQFVAILQAPQSDQESVERFKEKYDLGIPVIEDHSGKIANKLGVYSTPQAAIVKENKLFYRGNYNKARFCTSRNTRFAELAITAMIKGETPPIMPPLATLSYGCELPSNGFQQTRITNLFTN